MIKSMTGYGRENLSFDKREYQIEIKSVNHRYLDISIKLPRILSYIEEAIKKEIASKVKRGKIDVFVTFENNSTEGKQIEINKDLAKIYIEELRDLAKKENISSNIEVTEITKYPDVLTIKNVDDDEKITKEVTEVAKLAIDKLIEMRKTEGEKIAEDLLKRINEIEAKIEEISRLSTGLIEDYVVKLEGRIKELLKDHEIDKARLAEEVVIYADKCSVEEEITRLKSHIAQFKNMLKSNEACRKKTRLYNTRDE